MSSAGQIVGGLVGGAVGSFVGNPYLGAQLGMMLGGYIDPGDGVTEEGPRLSDLTVQTSTYGAVIPDLYGTDAVPGNVFWLQGNKIDETPVKKKTGGKGGQKKKTTVTWVNTATFAIGLCKGPVVGVRRIWMGGELFYDAGSTDPGTIAASNAAAEWFKVYLGTDTQTADPRIQADLGVANTPAWRGRAYIVFYDLDLAKYGGSLVGVQAKVELYSAASYARYPVTPVTTPSYSSGIRTIWTGSEFIRLYDGNANAYVSTDGVTWVAYPTGAIVGSPSWSGLSYGNGVIVAPYQATGCRLAVSADHGHTWSYVSLSSFDAGNVPFGNGTFVLTGSSHWLTSSDGYTWVSGTLPNNSGGNGTRCLFSGSKFFAWQNSHSKAMTSVNGQTWTMYSLSLSNHNYGLAKGGEIFLGSTGSPALSSLTGDAGSWVTRAAIPFTQSMVADNDHWLAFGNSAFAYSLDGDTWTTISGTLPYISAWTGGCFNGAVISIANTGSVTGANIVPFIASPTAAALSAIVASECLQSGLLTSGDIDVTQLTDMVRGYTDSSTGSIRDSLSPLQTAWPFDVRQRGYKLEFVRRGGASIRTIDANDLDARGPSTSPGVKITQAREMNLQLPRSVTVNHKDYDREYAVGEQYAERLSTDAVNEVAYELPIVMTASEAAQKADILLYLAWMERVDLSFSLPNTYLNLEPGDVISLPVNGSSASVRIVSLTYTSDGRIEVTGKFAYPSTYVSSAVGVTTLVAAQTTLSLPGGSSYELMDLPVLHATQLDPSFLAAMYGPTGWIGGVLLRSDDSGTTWADLQAFSSPGGTVGSATSVIGVVDSRVWDNASVLSVGMANGELFSVTAEAVLNGSNYFAYGADGRWEIIGVKTCALVSANTYNLSTLLRGRFGTEWAMSTHLSGDKVVLLSDTDVTAIGLSISVIGLMRTYRGVTLDQDVSTATDTFFTYAGVNLKPLSAAYCTLYRDVTSDDIVGSWVRRTRYGGEWADSIDVPLYETSESYQVDIFTDGSYSTVVRTLSASSQSVVYSAAEQTSDFGSYPATVYYKLYQLSSDVGRGYPFIGQANF